MSEKSLKLNAVKDGKRSLQVNVRLSPENLKLMRQAAEHMWPGVPLSNSTLLLTLANQKVQEVMDHKGQPQKSRR